jgi:hypothetical protein
LVHLECLADPPSIKYIVPSALAPGKTTEVTFVGRELGASRSLWMSFDAKAEMVSCAAERAVFKISLPPNTSTDLGAVRLAGSNGVSSLHLLMFDGLPTQTANGTNHSMANAQHLKKLPVAVEGACEEKASDFFKFTARKGERLSFDVVAARLGLALDPLARLFDSSGRELVFCEDTPGAGVDCRFSYAFARSGEYVIELRDTRYEGGRQHRYRLRAGAFQWSAGPLPFRARPDVDKSGSSLPNLAEVEPNDAAAQPVSCPVCIHGQFDKPRDRDCFEFHANKGQRLVFHGRTRSLGSACDLYLRLESSEGKKLAESSMAGADEGSLTNTFKDAGTYRLVVEEAAQFGGPGLFYRLEIEPFRPGFGLSVDTEKVQAASGGNFEIKVSPERVEYDGPITLGLEGAGEGFTLENNIITGKTNALALKVKLPARLEPGAMVNFRIIGRAKTNGIDFAAAASTRPALHKLFPHLSWPPPELDGWIALGVTAESVKKQEVGKELTKH